MRTVLLSSVLFGVLSSAALATAPVSTFPGVSTTLVAQLTPFGGAGLSADECNTRLIRMDRMLQDAGYQPFAAHRLAPGRTVVRWYHPDTDNTVLAFVNQRDVGRELQVTALPWRTTWNQVVQP